MTKRYVTRSQWWIADDAAEYYPRPMSCEVFDADTRQRDTGLVDKNGDSIIAVEVFEIGFLPRSGE